MSELFQTGIERTADVSPCGLYRWSLGRRWGDGPTVCFVMLNPSTADGRQDDPTIRRCIGFAKAWGYESLEVRNLFAWRAAMPKDLPKEKIKAIGGPDGDAALYQSFHAETVVWNQAKAESDKLRY